MTSCTNGHKLLPTAGRYRCSECLRCRPAELHHACRNCKFDVCANCVPAPTLSQYMIHQMGEFLQVRMQQIQMIDEWLMSPSLDMTIGNRLQEKDYLLSCLERHYSRGSSVVTGPHSNDGAVKAKNEELIQENKAYAESLSKFQTKFAAEIQKGKQAPQPTASVITTCLLGHSLGPVYGSGTCTKCFTEVIRAGVPHQGCITCDYKVCGKCNASPPPTELQCSLAAVKNLVELIDTTLAYIEAYLGGENYLQETVSQLLTEAGPLTKSYADLCLNPGKFPELQRAHDGLVRKLTEFQARSVKIGAVIASKPNPLSPLPSSSPSARTDPAPAPTPHPSHLPDPSTFKCKANHPLQHRVPAYLWKCDFCAKSGVKGTSNYSCHPCMFDVCLDCVASGGATSTVPPPMAVRAAPNAIAPPGTPVFRPTMEKTPCPEPTCTPSPSGVVVHITSVSGLPTKSSDLYWKIICGSKNIESKKFNPKKDFQKPNKRDFRFMFNWTNTTPLDFEFYKKKTLGSDKKIASCRVTADQIATSANYIEFVSQNVPIQPKGQMAIRLLLAGSGVSAITCAPTAMQESHMRGVVEKAAKKTKGLSGDFAAKDMKVQCVVAVDAIATRLVSFGESRHNESRIAPIRGNLDAIRRQCLCRDPVSAWSYEVRVPPAFEPHMICGSCCGRGWNDCYTCGATGWLPCNHCECRGVLLSWWETIVSFGTVIDSVPRSWSACEDLKDEFDFLKPKILAEALGTILWEEEVPVFTKAPVVPKGLEADSEAVFRLSQQRAKKSFGVLHQQKVVIVRVPVTQLCYHHPHDKIQRFFWAAGEGSVTVTVAAHPRHIIGSIMDTSTDGWVTLSEADAKMAMQVEVKSSQVKDKTYKTRAVAAAGISGKIYKMHAGFNSRLKLRDFALVGNELMWFDGEEKQGGVCLAGVQQRNIALSDKPTKLSAGLAKDKDSPFKKGGEGWSLFIRLEKKCYHLVFVDRKEAEKWLRELHVAITAPAKQV